MTQVTVRVPAKLNLQLAVGPCRADGYHDLVTVFHAVSLYDEVTVAPSDNDEVSVSGEGAASVPADGDNLALRAVRALREALPGGAPAQTGSPGSPGSAGPVGPVGPAGIGDPVKVTIRKRIPVAAGLAGGSADAAAALVACNELWDAGLTQQQLCDVAADVGSDVAFAVLGGTVVGRGRGEELTPALVPSKKYHWVLAFADARLATPEVYGTLDRIRPRAAEPELDAGLMAALRSGDPARVGKALSNDLQQAALTMCASLRKTLAAGTELGALGAQVSGSGPTCMFLARNAERALALAAGLTGAGVCRSVATATGPVPGAVVRH